MSVSYAPTPSLTDERVNTDVLVGVQYLRGFAALLVVAYHATANLADPAILNLPGPALWNYGYLGVDLFFVISGFIITHTALAPATGQPTMSIRQFAHRRFLRIVPFMWLCILGYAALRWGWRGSETALLPYLRALVLWPVGELKPDVIWTLRHEALFYLVFACAFLLRPNLRILLPLWALSPLALDAFRPIGSIEKQHDLIEFIANPVNVQFGMGAALGFLLRWPSRPAFAAPAALNGWRGYLLLAVLVACLLLTGYSLDLKIMTLRTTIIAGLLASAMLAVSAMIPSQAQRTDWLASLGRLLGDASYAIYLTHLPAMLLLFQLLRRLAPSISWPAAMTASVFVGALAGVIIHLLVEKPLLRALRRTREPRVKGA